MAKKYKCCAILCSCFHTVKSCFLNCRICNCLSNCCFIFINHSCIIPNLAKHRLCNCNGFKFVLILFKNLCHLVIFSSMHEMCRLHHKILYSIFHCAVKSLLHIVNHFPVSCLNVVDDDLSSKCSSYGPVRISFLQSVFNSFNVLNTAVVIGGSKAYYQKLVLANLICIACIIFGSVSGVQSKVIRAGILAFHQLFLCIGKGIPGFFCSFTVIICCFCSFLNINFVDQRCHIVCCLLICICAFFSCSFSFLSRSFCCCFCIGSINAGGSHHRNSCYSHQ